ncbi:MAG: glycosyltransferase family 4 protein [Pseudomonadota bacterium]
MTIRNSDVRGRPAGLQVRSARKALYVGNFEFPDGNAAGKRVAGNLKLLQRVGYQTAAIGVSRNMTSGSGLSEAVTIDAVVTRNLPYPEGLKGWARVGSAYRQVRSFLDEDPFGREVSLVIFYGSPVASLFCLLLIRACRRRRIRIVSDCVDWLSVSTRSPVFDAIKFADNLLQKRLANTRVDGVICVSRYLADYYERHGLTTIVIPPTAGVEDSVDAVPATRQESREKRLLYAGKPFRPDMKKDSVRALKDRIDVVLRILRQLKAEGCSFKLNVYGFREGELLDVLPSLTSTLEALGDSAVFHGQVSSEEVFAALAVADFSVLVRDVKRETLSGFPTKVAESIRQGVPVLVTDIGDISEYVSDGVHGFLLAPTDFDAQCAGIRKALTLTHAELAGMRNACLHSMAFREETYAPPFVGFLRALGLVSEPAEQH